MKKFEYSLEAWSTSDKNADIHEEVQRLNKFGAEGWQLVYLNPISVSGGVHYVAVFMRELL